MKTNILATATALSDRDLLASIDALAGKEREATADLVAHLAALEMRPALYAAQGYGSLFAYCTQALRLSEDAACNRIEAARVCRLFPAMLDLLASGSMNLTSARLVGRHLTADNYQAVVAKAANRTRQEIDALVAELAPQPDLAASVRKLPLPKTTPLVAGTPSFTLSEPMAQSSAMPGPSMLEPTPPSPAAFTPTCRPIVRASAPQRYRVQFTMGQETHDDLRRVQALLRREIPDGDPGAIFARAVRLLLEKVEKEKLGATGTRRRRAIRPGADSGRLIRSRTDKQTPGPALPSRHVPAEVKRAVWRRDAGQCAFVAHTGRRCTERTYLELHHVQPYARQGAATVANISLRCRRHNQYEAELVFGPHGPSTVGETREGLGSTGPGTEQQDRLLKERVMSP